jgi:hypothetical protein
VFVSHAGVDTERARWAAGVLRSAGYEVELDHTDWPAGDDFLQRMAQALATCQLMVALWSPAYFAEGSFALRELQAAEFARIRVVPLRLVAFTPPPLWGHLIYRDLFGLDDDRGRGVLLDAVIGSAGNTSEPPPLPDRRRARQRTVIALVAASTVVVALLLTIVIGYNDWILGRTAGASASSHVTSGPGPGASSPSVSSFGGTVPATTTPPANPSGANVPVTTTAAPPPIQPAQSTFTPSPSSSPSVSAPPSAGTTLSIVSVTSRPGYGDGSSQINVQISGTVGPGPGHIYWLCAMKQGLYYSKGSVPPNTTVATSLGDGLFTWLLLVVRADAAASASLQNAYASDGYTQGLPTGAEIVSNSFPYTVTN